jgi:hypothetical protein
MSVKNFSLWGEVMPENWGGGNAPDLRSIFGGIDATGCRLKNLFIRPLCKQRCDS